MKVFSLTMDLLARKIFLLLGLALESQVLAGKIHRIPLSTSHALTMDAVQERSAGHGISKDFIEEQEDNLKGKPGQGYYMEMAIGTPPQQLNILVDTGSSNFAVAAAPHELIDSYFNTSLSETFKDIGTSVMVPYTQGNWAGHLGRDIVMVTSLPNISVEAKIACIDHSENFFINGSNWQGILGLAYADIARPDGTVEPFYDSLTKQTDIANVFSMHLCGTVDTTDSTDVGMGGTLIIGGIDKSLYTGHMLYALLHREWYYEVIITEIKVDRDDVGMDCKEYNFDKTIVDSGTTNLRLPDKVFQKVVALIQKNTHLENKTYTKGFFSGEDLLCWPVGTTNWEAFPLLTISLAVSANTTMDLIISPQQYLRAVAGQPEDCYKFAVVTSKSGTVLGAVVMEGYYVVFDRDGRRIGFAKSTCQNRDPVARSSDVMGPRTVMYDTLDCAYVKPDHKDSTLLVAAYIMAGVCCICLLPFGYMFLQWLYQGCRGRKRILTDDSTLLDGEFEPETLPVPTN